MARKVTPFVLDRDSDGCTIISKPYQWLTKTNLPQRPCCDKHDEWYHYGGSHSQRLQADRELRDCVRELGQNKVEQVAFQFVGWIMYAAVRVGGSPKLPFPWRWRNNVPFELEDIKSGYLNDPLNYDEERVKDAKLLYAIAEQTLAVVANADNTTGLAVDPGTVGKAGVIKVIGELAVKTVESVEELKK